MFDIKNFTHIRRWYAFHLVLCVTFFISSLFINLVQFALYVTLRQFNKSLYRSINYYLTYSLMSQILFLSEWWSGSDLRVYTSDDSYAHWGNEHAMVVMNHNYEVDWLMGWMVADRSAVLGAAKVFVKNMMKYVPTIGWAWSCSDIIFLHRNWQEDKSIMEEQIKEFFDYPHPVWMLLFCEGTRFTPDKHAASMEFAKKRGLTPLKHLLIPRTRGFIQCVQSMKGHFPAIYDVTVAFDVKPGGPEPTMLNMLRGEKIVADLYVRRLLLDDVPSEEDKITEYLHELYRTKDKLLDSYYNTGSFTKESGLPECAVRKMPRRYYSLLNSCCWGVIVFSVILHQFYALLTTGSILANSIAILVVILAYFGLYKMISLTHINKGSKYGHEAKKDK